VRGFVFQARPSRDFVPAADLLFAPPKSRQKALPCKTAPAGCPAMLEAQGRAELAPLRSAQTSVASQFLKRAARAPWASALLGGLKGEAPNSRTANSQTREPSLTGLFLHPPFSVAEERSGLQPRAQRASSSDSAQLSDRSVAKGVLRGVARREHRRAARCEAKGRRGQGRLFAFFLVAQKEGRPPGRRPGMGLATKQALRAKARNQQET
jgi:hypothetical protein